MSAHDFDEDDDDEPAPPSDSTDEERELAREIVELLKAGRKIDAVKRYREATGVGLADAVAFVNRISEKHGIARPTGCGTTVLLLALLGWLAAAVA